MTGSWFPLFIFMYRIHLTQSHGVGILRNKIDFTSFGRITHGLGDYMFDKRTALNGVSLCVAVSVDEPLHHSLERRSSAKCPNFQQFYDDDRFWDDL